MLRDEAGTAVWNTATGRNDGATLRLSDRGELAIVLSDARVWLEGVPAGTHEASSRPDDDSSNLVFPVRATFYYPWFPETWTVGGAPVHYTPSLGLYRTGQEATQRQHIAAMEYAHVQLAIASWFGPSTNPARLTNLLEKSKGTSLKWSVYHEGDRRDNPSVAAIRSDLEFLSKWFTWHDAYAHVNDKPVIFVYNLGDCNVGKRWREAAGEDWYVVLKLFRNHEECAVQPNHWHEYGPATAVVTKREYSVSISPGFWRADIATPRLERLSEAEWRQNVKFMVDSQEPWQLITTFNEWGEGTAVESGTAWETSSGYGYYVDALHDIVG